MSVNPEYIEQLVLDEIAGVITPEDSATLKDLLAQEPEALVIRNDLYAQYAHHPALDTLSESLPVEKIWDGIRKKKKGNVLLRTAISIAAAALIIIGTYKLFEPGTKLNPQTTQTTSPKNVTLQLPNGQQVDLETQKEAIQIGQVTLNNQQKQLSYSGGKSTQVVTLIVPTGKDYTVKLPDSTIIQLNAGSTIEFPLEFNGSTRNVSINGEAYLDVAKDPTRPFCVHLPHAILKVLGTAFNVNTYDSGHVNVSLVKGAVKLHTAQDSILLHPGYAVDLHAGSNPHETPFDAEEVLSWRQGIYIFNNATVAEISKVVTRWYGVQVVIDNPTARQHRFRGFIDRNQSIRPFLDGLKFTGQFDYYFDKDSVLHMQ